MQCSLLVFPIANRSDCWLNPGFLGWITKRDYRIDIPSRWYPKKLTERVALDREQPATANSLTPGLKHDVLCCCADIILTSLRANGSVEQDDDICSRMMIRSRIAFGCDIGSPFKQWENSFTGDRTINQNIFKRLQIGCRGR